MKIRLSSILLFVLVTPFIMNYSLSVEGTSYWLFALIFLSLIIFIILDFFQKNKNYFFLKSLVLWLTIVLVIGSAFYSAIYRRHKVSPVFEIHDIILQQEAAIRYLFEGKNPYVETYFGTPMEEWSFSDTEVNPALYHFVMQPFYLIFAIPFYRLAIPILGFYDTRLALYFLFFILLFMAWKLVEDKEEKVLFVTLLAFNPAMLPYTLEGRSDIFMFAFMFAGFYLLQKEKLKLAGVPLALAFAIKQSAWPFFPFYLAFLYLKTKDSLLERIKFTAGKIWPFGLTLLIFVLPFAFWDLKAYLDSTVFYLSGNVEHSYPIAGYGFGMLLHEFGFISDLHQKFPFLLWQAIFGIPVLIFLFKIFKKHINVKNMILSYGIFLFVFWYFSRYFNNSHVAYLSVVFTTAYFWPDEKPEKSHESTDR